MAPTVSRMFQVGSGVESAEGHEIVGLVIRANGRTADDALFRSHDLLADVGDVDLHVEHVAQDHLRLVMYEDRDQSEYVYVRIDLADLRVQHEVREEAEFDGAHWMVYYVVVSPSGPWVPECEWDKPDLPDDLRDVITQTEGPGFVGEIISATAVPAIPEMCVPVVQTKADWR